MIRIRSMSVTERKFQLQTELCRKESVTLGCLFLDGVLAVFEIAAERQTVARLFELGCIEKGFAVPFIEQTYHALNITNGNVCRV